MGATRSTLTEITPSCFCRTPSSSKNFLRHNQHPVLIQDVGRDDRIADAGFVFQAEKDKSLCGSRPLPRNHAARGAHMTAMRSVLQFLAERMRARRRSARRYAMGCGPTVSPVP